MIRNEASKEKIKKSVVPIKLTDDERDIMCIIREIYNNFHKLDDARKKLETVKVKIDNFDKVRLKIEMEIATINKLSLDEFCTYIGNGQQYYAFVEGYSVLMNKKQHLEDTIKRCEDNICSIQRWHECDDVPYNKSVSRRLKRIPVKFTK